MQHGMSKVFRIKKGKDIPLDGLAAKSLQGNKMPSSAALKPTDFRNLIPKLEVKAGMEVKAGDVLFYDKSNPQIKFTSPVSGEVAEVVRGERRAIQEIRVLLDQNIGYKAFDTGSANSREGAKELLLDSGLWPFMVERPFGVIANPDETPKAIHISCFDSSPLAPDYTFTLEGESAAFARGISLLKLLTNGAVHINVDGSKPKPSFISDAKGAIISEFIGPHPAGLVGVQIHHIDAINKGDIVWTLNPQSVVFIGRLMINGHVDLRKKIAVAGSQANNPSYVETIHGANIENLVGKLKEGNTRIISGGILTGTKIGSKGYLGFHDNGILAIPEGDHFEFLGWLFPSYARPTISNSLPISKFLKKSFAANTNMHGEERAFVVSGEYEKVLPMDILPVQLLKATLAQDLEAMENLGIYEVIEEDLALCEFVCTSKIEVQQILSDGIKLMEEES
ncbi:MAG: Na+-transporting NADH:ubiquinone oxidoreductase subunit A [Bacteroidia bacterium]|jgi:Na+-transporting NADH:ubiquinone oxidoreductase subunit A